MQEKTYLFDTNILLDHPEILKDFNNVVFSTIVLKELDSQKYSDSLGYAARSAIRAIRDYIGSEKQYIFDTNQDTAMTNDMNIIMSAKRNKAILMTKDIAASLLAESFAVECELVSDRLISDFSPYIYDKNSKFKFESYDLAGEELDKFKEYILEKFKRELTPWTYYILNKDIYCYNPNKEMLECISKKKNYCKVELDGAEDLKPKDQFQKAAIYSIMNADATLILGKWASGKTLLATACALSLSEGRKVFVMRPTLSSKKYDLGFLPGDKQEKLYQYLSGFMSALGFLFGNTRTTQSGKAGVSYDYVKEDLSKEKFEYLSLPELHGLSVQSGDILICDEIQILDLDYMTLLLSRMCEGSKLIMLGDMNQTMNLIQKADSGLGNLLKKLPHTSLSVVELKNVYRNKELTDLADKLCSK